MFFTLHQVIYDTVKAFKKAKLYYGHGTDNPLDEAVYLILHTLKLPLNIDLNYYNPELTSIQYKSIQKIINLRIKTRKPSAYLTHQAFFMGLDFYVDERVLIPRSPMAELIYQKFQPWIKKNKIKNILDLCTGSGCIAITCAKTFPKANITASDISQKALDVSKINLKKHKIKNIKLIKSNLFNKIPKNKKFDIIISNPPYVDQKDMNSLPKEYQHEPALGLKAGKDGLDLVKKILNQAKNYLSDHGILIIEIGNSQAALIKQFPDLPFIWLELDAEIFLLRKEDLLNFNG